MSELYDIFYGIIQEKYKEDPDGDIPIEVDIVNRHKFNRSNFVHVPYHHLAETEEDEDRHERAISLNFSIAARDVDNWFKVRGHERYLRRKEKEDKEG